MNHIKLFALALAVSSVGCYFDKFESPETGEEGGSSSSHTPVTTTVGSGGMGGEGGNGEGGEVLGDECYPNYSRCDDLDVVTCNADGTAETLSESCTYACDDGACLPKDCEALPYTPDYNFEWSECLTWTIENNHGVAGHPYKCQGTQELPKLPEDYACITMEEEDWDLFEYRLYCCYQEQ